MNQTEARIHELLERNLFLDAKAKAAAKLATPAKQAEILPTLEAMDRRQTKLFTKVLRSHPDFFENLVRQAMMDPDCRIKPHRQQW